MSAKESARGQGSFPGLSWKDPASTHVIEEGHVYSLPLTTKRSMSLSVKFRGGRLSDGIELIIG